MNKIIFVSDAFAEDFLGGAELTTNAIIDKSPFEIDKVRSHELSIKFIKDNSHCRWIFGNFFGLKDEIIFYFIKSKISYDVIEYDYKFCEFRSPQKHELIAGTCDCSSKMRGKIVSLFFNNSRKCWFMSNNQKDYYLKKFSFLKDEKVAVLGSVFKDSTINNVLNLKCEKNNSFLILKTQNWIKGMDNAISFAKEKGLNYHLVGNVSHNQMLEHLSKSKGLIFMPNGFDTCPRITIEAKLLDCKLYLNDNVQHANEEWFTGSKEKMVEYLLTNCDKLWSTFK